MDHGGADQPDPPGGGSGGSLFIGLGVLIGPRFLHTRDLPGTSLDVRHAGCYVTDRVLLGFIDILYPNNPNRNSIRGTCLEPPLA